MKVHISKKYIIGTLGIQLFGMLMLVTSFFTVSAGDYFGESGVLPMVIFTGVLIFAFIYQLYRFLTTHKNDYLYIGPDEIEYSEGLKVSKVSKRDIKKVKFSKIFSFEFFDVSLNNGQRISLSRFYLTEELKDMFQEWF